MPLKLMINGARGRMGRTLIDCVEADPDLRVVVETDTGDDPEQYIDMADVVIDFSAHMATLPLVRCAAGRKTPIVIGTTGHSREDREAISGFSETLPMVWAGNYSVGVNLLLYLTEQASRILSADYHPEVIEMHHRHKVDAPSGTARDLAEAVRAARQWGDAAVVDGRSGITGERPDEQLGMHAIRGGSIVGEHTVLFAGEGERIELTHRAADRKIFATGALHAAKWVARQTPGLYSMRDVLGLREA
ncbi:MAG: 4-hydroxy-tetrahydrodipicolinate reductase [Opitutales bacterium]